MCKTHFAVQQKFIQHYKSTIRQEILKRTKTSNYRERADF